MTSVEMENKDEMQCKICLETDGNDLIAPCYCSGSSKWIHRSCLDTWRSTHAGRAFTHCGLCGFEYVIEMADDSRDEECRRIRWKMYVARDTLAVFLLIQAVIIILGFIVKAMDVNGVAREAFPHFLSDHEKTSYYIWGFIVFLASLGLIGTVLKCINHPLFETGGNRPANPYVHGAPNIQERLDAGLVRQHTPRRRANGNPCCTGNNCQGCYCDDPHYCGDCRGCYCGDCGTCHGCNCGNCNCSGDLKEGVILILIIALVILVFVGLFVVIFLGSLLVQKIMQRHMRILWLREETKKYVVVDFSTRTLPPRSAVHWDEEMGSLQSEPDHDREFSASRPKPVDSKTRLYQSRHPKSEVDIDLEKELQDIPQEIRKSKSDAPSAPEQSELEVSPPLARSLSGGPPGGARTKTFPDGLFD